MDALSDPDPTARRLGGMKLTSMGRPCSSTDLGCFGWKRLRPRSDGPPLNFQRRSTTYPTTACGLKQELALPNIALYVVDRGAVLNVGVEADNHSDRVINQLD